MNKRIIFPALLFVVLFVFAACNKTPNPAPAETTTTEPPTTTNEYGWPFTTIAPETEATTTTVPFVLPTKPQGKVDKFQLHVPGYEEFDLGKLSADEFEKLAKKKGIELYPNSNGELRRETKAFDGSFSYDTDFVTFHFSSDEILEEIIVWSPDIPSALGLKRGDPWWAVEAVYGKPTRSWNDGGTFEYYNGKSVITFMTESSPGDNAIIYSWRIASEQNKYIPDAYLDPTW